MSDKDKDKGKVTIESLAEEEQEDKPKDTTKGKSVLEWLAKTPSPSKSVDSYQSHPLNYDGDESTSRIIRGASGLLGNLDKASVDILVGVFKKMARLFKKEGSD